MKIKLKPCPFCGGKAEMSKSAGDSYAVFCTSCYCFGERSRKKNYAARAWNKRSTDWISVKDRLPEKSGKYLVLFANSKIQCVEYYDKAKAFGYWAAEVHDELPSHAIEYYFEPEEDEAVAWIPLPEPPEKEEK